MLTVCVFLAQLAAADGLEGRMAELESQFGHLHKIVVEDAFAAEREARMNALRARLDGGPEDEEDVNRIYLELDGLRSWLLDHAADRPRLPEGQFRDEGASWVVQTPKLSLRINKVDLAMQVRTAGAAWEFVGCATDDVKRRRGEPFSLASARTKTAQDFVSGFSYGLLLTLGDFPAAPGAELKITASLIGDEIVFDLAAPGEIAFLDRIEWPKSIRTEAKPEHVSVLCNMQGILLPGDYDQDFSGDELIGGRKFYMPWWGHLRGRHGVQAIFETSHDAGGVYDHPAGGPTRVQPFWASSLNEVRYLRTLRYCFSDDATYVTMAKRYRRFVQETGRFLSLDQKRTGNPMINEVIGRPVVHTGTLSHTVAGSRFYRTEQMERNHRLRTFAEVEAELRWIKEQGFEDAYVHLDGWGFRGYDNVHPDVIPPGPEQGGWDGLRQLADTADELGYLLAVHDQYRDFYLPAVSFDDKLAVHNWDGTRTEHAEWAGSYQTFLSPRFAPGYVRRNHDAFAMHGVKIRGAYLDVFAIVPLEESFQAAHPVTRSDCARYRRECFDLLRARGYVVSSEEPADYCIDAIDLLHHGPYPTSPKGYGPGEGIGIAVPLFNLVYHDSVLTPWYPTEDGGWGIPNGDSGALHCILNAGLPYVGGGYPEARLEMVKAILPIAKRLNTKEMVNHEFLDASRRIQRTTFSDGTRVTVDFEKKTYDVEP